VKSPSEELLKRPKLKCAKCGHTDKKHNVTWDGGHEHCNAIGCPCPKFYHVAEATTAAIEAAVKAGELCKECNHSYSRHKQVDDHQKQQAHWPCMDCFCDEFRFYSKIRSVDGIMALLDEKCKDDDPVNHPSHYTAYPGVEVIQLTRHMSFNRGNAVKYTARAGLKDKNTEIQDLEKAVWYLQDEIKLLKGEYEV